MSTRQRDSCFTATVSIAAPYDSGITPEPEVVWPHWRTRTGRYALPLPPIPPHLGDDWRGALERSPLEAAEEAEAEEGGTTA